MRWSKLLVLAAALAAASCNIVDPAEPKPSDPAAVARVTVSPDTTAVQVGKSIRLNAAVVDANGRPVTDRTVEWFSNDASIATVDNTGNVTGIAQGSVTIAASVDGKRGSARINVAGGGGSVAITSIAPSTLVEGQPAVIYGQNFGEVTTNNRVLVGGVAAYITASTSSSIQFTVPSMGCKPQQQVNVQVQVLTAASNIVKTLIRPQSTLNMRVGEQIIGTDPAFFCLQFAGSNASEAYLVGVQSVTENGALATQAVVTSAGAASGNTTDAILDPLPVVNNFRSVSIPAMSVVRDEMRRREQRRAEGRMIAGQQALLQKLRARSVSPTANSVSAPSVPASVRVGDVLAMRIGHFGSDQCENYASFNAVVRLITPHSIVVEDVANPAGGFTLAQLQTMANLFDNYAYDTDVSYFGSPSDLDGNGRIVLAVTKEVNKQSALESADFDMAARVNAGNWFPSSTCPASNVGELIYLRAPDINGVFGRQTKPIAKVLTEEIELIPHEFAHILQFSKMILNSLPLPPNWLMEGQAMFAEEVNGFRVSGRTPGMNYGYSVIYETVNTNTEEWYHGLSEISWWYGYLGTGSTTRVTNAPEACTWMVNSWDGNNGPCAHVEGMVYGWSYTFLRWLSDQFGPSYPGGEKALQRAIVGSNIQSGFGRLASIVNVPIDTLLAQFAAAIYVDDRVPGLASRLTMTSWNLYDIELNKVPLSRLTPHEHNFGVYSHPVTVQGGSVAYFRISGNGHPATGVKVVDPNGNPLPKHMRLWIVRLQ